MGRVELRTFADDFVRGAGALLAQRHRAHCATEPLLSQHVDFEAEVQDAFDREGASGAVALRGGSVVAYLLGAPRRGGRNVWVEIAGHAALDPEDARDLYALVASTWVDEGRLAHHVLIPATDLPLADAWFRLGFGAQHAHGIQSVPQATSSDLVREATIEDIDLCLQLEDELSDYQRRAPVFAGGPPRSATDGDRTAWRDELEDESSTILIAVDDGSPAAAITVAPVERCREHVGLGRPENACIIGWAATLEHHRGRGLGVASPTLHSCGHEGAATPPSLSIGA